MMPQPLGRRVSTACGLPQVESPPHLQQLGLSHLSQIYGQCHRQSHRQSFVPPPGPPHSVLHVPHYLAPEPCQYPMSPSTSFYEIFDRRAPELHANPVGYGRGGMVPAEQRWFELYPSGMAVSPQAACMMPSFCTSVIGNAGMSGPALERVRRRVHQQVEGVMSVGSVDERAMWVGTAAADVARMRFPPSMSAPPIAQASRGAFHKVTPSAFSTPHVPSLPRQIVRKKSDNHWRTTPIYDSESHVCSEREGLDGPTDQHEVLLRDRAQDSKAAGYIDGPGILDDDNDDESISNASALCRAVEEELENDLPLKKRKHKINENKQDLKPEYKIDLVHCSPQSSDGEKKVSIDSIPMKLNKPCTNCQCGFDQTDRNVCQTPQQAPIERSFHCEECRIMQCSDKSKPGLDGKFNTWSSTQVKLWFWKLFTESHTPRDSHLQLGIHSCNICELLKKLEGKNGFFLSTYTKEEWEKELTGSGVSADIIWKHISEKQKLDSIPLRQFNYCEMPLPKQPVKSAIQKKRNITPSSSLSGITIAKTSTHKSRRRRDRCVGQLWEFVYNLLCNDETNPSVVCWEDKEKKMFRIVNTEEIARLWGQHKGNSNMTYANMSRTMRYYREGNGAFVRNERKRVYGFGPKADFKRLEARTAKKV